MHRSFHPQIFKSKSLVFQLHVRNLPAKAGILHSHGHHPRETVLPRAWTKGRDHTFRPTKECTTNRGTARQDTRWWWFMMTAQLPFWVNKTRGSGNTHTSRSECQWLIAKDLKSARMWEVKWKSFPGSILRVTVNAHLPRASEEEGNPLLQNWKEFSLRWQMARVYWWKLSKTSCETGQVLEPQSWAPEEIRHLRHPTELSIQQS